jgi:cell division protein FtsI/penicillin-binding protein 2
MTSTRVRIGVVGAVLAAGLVVVAAHLWATMVVEHEAWAARSDANRWSFRSVPGRRGALLDRFGRELVRDEPTMELAVHYLRFRLRHPVGAAVHGASTWADVRPDRDEVPRHYNYDALGPETAAFDLLAMPVAVLRRGQLPKHVASELASAAATVLAGGSDLPRRRVFAAIRRAANAGEPVAVGDVLAPLGVRRAMLLAAFTERLQALRWLDLALAADAASGPGLFATLELLRDASRSGARVQWQEDGRLRSGSRVEEVARVFAEHVGFDLAAELRVRHDRFVGIDVTPSLRRQRFAEPGTSLDALLGRVSRLDRSLPSEAWLEDLVDRELTDEWLADLVPPDGALPPDRDALAQLLRSRYARELLRCERRGTNGIEAAFDDELMGRLGLRFFERDGRRREQQLWSHLRVEAGADVAVTLDLDLQQAAEVAVRLAVQRHLHGDERDRDRVEAAIVALDAGTGDVLAYAGAPLAAGAAASQVPGLVWRHTGDLGSVVKPFVLVEQLQCESLGRPHAPLASLAACGRTFRYGGQVMTCGHAHGDAGRDPVEALAASCNLFFYQCAVGLGDEGIARSLRRFGLAPPTGPGDPFAACWQPQVRGLPAARPRRDAERTPLPKRAIGYGVEASLVDVARAYAGLATGWLPTLGLSPAPRPRVPLDDVVGELELARQGLRACVQRGTARRLRLLDELGVHGKTGTAEVGARGENNAWFAGWLPVGDAGLQLCLCAVVYWVEDGVHGGDAAGELVADLLHAVRADPGLQGRYLTTGGGR